MRAVVQRVSQAAVTAAGREVSRIEKGLLVYLGIERDDQQQDCIYMADKLVNLRCFADQQGKMNLSVRQAGGQVLIVSNFTVCADCRQGRRPSLDQAADPQIAEELYLKVTQLVKDAGTGVQIGAFGHDMLVSCINDGPVTFLLDSHRVF